MKNLIFIFFILILSCQKQNEKLIKERELLIQQNKSLKKENEKLKQSKNPIYDLSIETNPENQTESSTEILSVLDFTASIIVSDTLPKLLYESLVFEENDVSKYNTDYQFLYNLSLFANPNRNITNKFETDGSIKDVIKFVEYSKNYNYLIHYLFKRANRSPENINYLFDKNKEFAYKLLKTGNSYKTSGFERTIKILILSYEELHQKENLLNELITRSETSDVLSDTIYRHIESKKMKKLLSEFRDYEFVSYSNWVYSFWARRTKENNAEIVYEIIKEFDREMNKYKYTEEEIIEEDYYEEGF